MFKQIEPQKARGVLRESMWDDPNWSAEEKYDGDRRIAQFIGKRVRFTGRRKSVKDGLFVEKTDNLPHLNHTPPFLDGCILDGEIIVPAGFKGSGGLSKYVTAVMGSLPEEARAKQLKSGWLRYVVFDCLAVEGGRDLTAQPLADRQREARRIVLSWGSPHVLFTRVSRGAGKRLLQQEIEDAGGEGVILKNVHAPYGVDKEWVKVKRQATADVVILGYTEAKAESTKKDGSTGRTKYKGMVGAIRFGQYRDGKLVECGQASGMEDAFRHILTTEGKEYIGWVMQIKHNGREPSGAFRHPRFDVLRPDKTAGECVWDVNES